MYETSAGSLIPSTLFIDSASPSAASGTDFHAVPVDNMHKATISFTLRVTFEGDGFLELDYTL